ncbi:MAG: DMT family transporter [Alphaproteobacteria bacterium]
MTPIDTSPARGSARANLRAIGWMLATGLLFAMVTGIARHVGSDMNPIQAAFIRFAIGLAILAPVFLRVRFKPRRLGTHGLRGLVHGAAVMLWFYAMARIPIADVTALGFATPIYVTIGAVLFLREKLHLRRAAAVLAGFLGVLVILRPGFEVIQLGAVAQLVATPLFAVSFIFAKKLTETETNASIAAYLAVVVTLVLLPPALVVWRPPTWEELGWLSAIAVLATLGHLAMNQAFRSAEIMVTQPATFLQLVWATLIGIVVFGEEPELWIWAGAAIIVAAATYIARREAVAEVPASDRRGTFC